MQGGRAKGAKERIEGYRERAGQRKGIKTTEEGQRMRDWDYGREGEEKSVRERERERKTETGGKISL